MHFLLFLFISCCSDRFIYSERQNIISMGIKKYCIWVLYHLIVRPTMFIFEADTIEFTEKSMPVPMIVWIVEMFIFVIAFFTLGEFIDGLLGLVEPTTFSLAIYLICLIMIAYILIWATTKLFYRTAGCNFFTSSYWGNERAIVYLCSIFVIIFGCWFEGISIENILIGICGGIWMSVPFFVFIFGYQWISGRRSEDMYNRFYPQNYPQSARYL